VNWMYVFTVVQIMLIAIDSIAWRTFIVFAVFCACWLPVVYCFFRRANQLRLEDIDHLFEEGGTTGGVFRGKGRVTVEPGWHRGPRAELIRVRRRGLVSIGKASKTFLL
jgi:hypothetical protein